jgi:hypothetical protein
VKPREIGNGPYRDPRAQPYPYAPPRFLEPEQRLPDQHPHLMLYNQGQRAISPDLGLGPAGQSQTALSSSGFPTQVLNRNQVSSTNRVPSFQQNSQPTTPATQAAPLWPSIACPPESFKKGDIRWMRDMNEVLQAIPGNQVIIPLVNEFFLEARRSCEYP